MFAIHACTYASTPFPHLHDASFIHFQCYSSQHHRHDPTHGATSCAADSTDKSCLTHTVHPCTYIPTSHTHQQARHTCFHTPFCMLAIHPCTHAPTPHAHLFALSAPVQPDHSQHHHHHHLTHGTTSCAADSSD